jgi:hypothetical protein
MAITRPVMAITRLAEATPGSVGVDSQPTIWTARGAEVAFGSRSWALRPRFAREGSEIIRIRALGCVPGRNRRLTANTAAGRGTAG